MPKAKRKGPQFSMTVLKSRKYKGYVIRHEKWIIQEEEDRGYPAKTHKVICVYAYTNAGDRVGSPQFAHHLMTKCGIAPEKASPKHTICSIGFCEKDKKWYGWSHRGKCGFGIGDRIFEPYFGDCHTPYKQHGKIRIRTLKQAKQAAKAFARYIS